MTRHRKKTATTLASPAAAALAAPAMGMDAFRAAVKSAEMLSAAALTIGLRTSAMGAAWSGWQPHDHAENTRMVTEKMAAAGECAGAAAKGMMAMQSEALRLWTGGLGPWDVMGGLAAWSRLATLGLTGYGRMLAPYHKRTTANARRLGRKG